MATKPLPSPEVLRQLLRYDPETGKLFWCDRPDARPQWRARYVGKEALATTDDKSYLRGQLLGIPVKAHRVIWAMQTGEWPRDEIDHIDGDRSNNRWGNLREADRFQNTANTSSRKGATSKHLGVAWSTGRQKWRAQIMVRGKHIHLGYFDDEDEAARVRRAATSEHFGAFSPDDRAVVTGARLIALVDAGCGK